MMNRCTSTIPRLTPNQGTCILVTCILLGGWGTIYAACMAETFEYIQLCIGFAQLFIPIGGYVWAIIWGIKIYEKSRILPPLQPIFIATTREMTMPTLPGNIIQTHQISYIQGQVFQKYQ